jgi:hypothetical protein
MDPFSILGALSGVVHFARTTISILGLYHQEVEMYPKQFQNMVTELYSLYGIVNMLELALNNLSSSPHFQSLLETGFCPS